MKPKVLRHLIIALLTVSGVFQLLLAMLGGAAFHGERMRASLDRGFAQATDLADALVSERGVPFREAHHLVGALVRACVEANTTLALASREVRARGGEFFLDNDFYNRAVSLENSADKKISQGGTGAAPLEKQFIEAGQRQSTYRSYEWRKPDLDF